jgi:hypothetical protein
VRSRQQDPKSRETLAEFGRDAGHREAGFEQLQLDLKLSPVACPDMSLDLSELQCRLLLKGPLLAPRRKPVAQTDAEEGKPTGQETRN